MRNVFVKICEAQHEFEHAVALIGVRLVGAGFEMLDGGESVGKEPLQIGGAERFAALAVGEGLLGAHGSFIEKMIHAQLRANERGRDRAGTSGPVALSCGGAHRLTPV